MYQMQIKIMHTLSEMVTLDLSHSLENWSISTNTINVRNIIVL